MRCDTSLFYSSMFIDYRPILFSRIALSESSLNHKGSMVVFFCKLCVQGSSAEGGGEAPGIAPPIFAAANK